MDCNLECSFLVRESCGAVLMHFCVDDILLNEIITSHFCVLDIIHTMNQFIFECINLSQVDCEGHLHLKLEKTPADRQRDIPWDDPYPYYQGLIPPPDPIMDTDESIKSGAYPVTDGRQICFEH